jgi:hypothetical protein
LAQVERDQLAQIVDVLLPDRAVHAQASRGGCDVSIRRPHRDQREDRVSEHAQHDEQDCRRQHEGQQQQSCPSEEIAAYDAAFSMPYT